MKVVRLNGNDIKKLVQKIVKEDSEWFDNISEYNLIGIYYYKSVQKLDGVSRGFIMDVVNIDAHMAEVYIIPFRNRMMNVDYDEEVGHYLFHKVLKTSLKDYNGTQHDFIPVAQLIDDIEDGTLTKHKKEITESRLFGPQKKSADERIAEHILKKLETEIPDVQHQFLDTTKSITNFYNLTVHRGTLEADYFRVDFSNKSERISKNNKGIIKGGDFGVIKVYNPRFRNELGKRKNLVGYAIKLTDSGDPLKIPRYLAKKIFEKIEDQYGDIKTFKATRRLDKGTDDESDLFDQLG